VTSGMRRGFTMLTVLWLLAVASSIAVGATTIGRTAVDTGRNRIHLDRAHWLALGCARRIQAAADAALSGASSPSEGTRIWAALPANVGVAANECDVTWEAAGTRLDLNSANEEMLVRLFANAGVGAPDAAQSARAVRVWKEGADFSDGRELSRVPGYINSPGIDSLVSADPGRVFLGSANSLVLSAVPGITREAAEVIAQRARDGQPVADLADVLPLLSAAARDSLIARFPDATRATTNIPDGWLLHVSAAAGVPRSTATIRWRLMRNGERVVVTQSRILP
jgi:hypothetical protein